MNSCSAGDITGTDTPVDMAVETAVDMPVDMAVDAAVDMPVDMAVDSRRSSGICSRHGSGHFGRQHSRCGG